MGGVAPSVKIWNPKGVSRLGRYLAPVRARQGGVKVITVPSVKAEWTPRGRRQQPQDCGGLPGNPCLKLQ